MTAPIRIQRQRTKGWRMPEGAIYVGRPTRWGNPFTIERDGAFFGRQLYRIYADDPSVPPTFYGGEHDLDHALEQIVALYRRWLTSSQARVDDLVPLLAGHDLACWCALDKPCHADVLIELANPKEDDA